MKAVILAGGMGTRGKPYTEYFPKAMTPIGDKPLIDYIVRYLRSFRFVGEIIIVSDFEGLGGQIKNYYGNQKNITFVQDSQSGTGGDLLHVKNRLKKEEFLLWFVDNLCAIDLRKMREQFRKNKSSACIATRKKRKEKTGFAVIRDGIITEFREKPTMRLHLSECLGIYMLGSDIINQIRAKQKKTVNLSYDILQQLSKEGKISAFDIGDTEWIDAESPAVLEKNAKTVKKITRQMGF